MKRKIRVSDLKRLIAESLLVEAPKTRDPGGVPSELVNLVKRLPGLKLSKTPNGWFGSVKISEKRKKEQAAFGRAWSKVKQSLTEKPWQSNAASRSGWDSAYDVGGNYARNEQAFVHPSGLVVKISSDNSFSTGTKSWTLIADIGASVAESYLREASDDPVTQETDDSLDVQVDRYLASYENEAKSSKVEGRDFRMLTRRLISEAEGDDDESGEGASEELAAPVKLSIDDIDIESFVNGVVRLIDNYDSLIEVRSTIARRAKNFLLKSYDTDVVDTFEQVMREDHGLVAGKSKEDVEAEDFVAPPAERAGPGGEGGAPA